MTAVTLKRIGLSWVAAYALTLAFLLITDSDGEGHVSSALWGIAAFIVCGALVAFVNLIGWWLYLWLAQGDDFDQFLLGDLRARKVLSPRRGQSRTFSYLAELADDPRIDPKERVKAAVLFGSYSIMLSKAGVFGGMAWGKALDRAVLRYAQENPDSAAD